MDRRGFIQPLIHKILLVGLQVQAWPSSWFPIWRSQLKYLCPHRPRREFLLDEERTQWDLRMAHVSNRPRKHACWVSWSNLVETQGQGSLHLWQCLDSSHSSSSRLLQEMKSACFYVASLHALVQPYRAYVRDGQVEDQDLQYAK